MGKKSNLGRAIIKDRFANQRTKHQHSFLHTTELDDGYDWNRLNLKSVTEENTLDEFLNTAELAGTEFIAEKSNVAIVTNSTGLTTPAEERCIRLAQDAHRQQLKIPRRPAWDSSTTPEQLDQMEREAFLEWRRSLAKLQEVEGIVMTPYERNLDFWRQLWRVIERSDVVVQIVDARNPLLFRCEDLEAYVKEVDPNKISMILLNKADYLTHEQRVQWASYFDNIGVLIAFWSATEEAERLKSEVKCDVSAGSKDQRLEIPEENDSNDDDSDDNLDVDTCDNDDDSDDYDDRDTDDDEDDDDGWETVEEEEEEEICCDSSVTRNTANRNRVSDSSEEGAGVARNDRAFLRKLKSATPSKSKKSTSEGWTSKHKRDKPSSVGSASKVQINNSSDILTGSQLIQLFESFSVNKSSLDGVVTIGMVGYPNVGKSSTINALLQTKRVSVSATPGHTKHFQTLCLTSSLVLCDCPGLVMPSFVSTKADMVVSGILPVDQMRDFVPPVSLVCKYIHRDVLETTYGIMLPEVSEGDDPNRCPTAYEFLGAYATVRGFMTHKGIPDYQRAARCVLKDYVNGKLLHCVAPPGVDPAVFEPKQSCVKAKKPAAAMDKKPGSSSGPESAPGNQQDAAFFAQIASRVRSGGVGGVVGFTRTRGYGGYHVSNAADSSASDTAVGGKPSKRHNNSNKKEKLRRVTAYLDA